MLQRLYANWVYGTFPAAFAILSLLPLQAELWPASLMLLYLHLPAYMIHQYEEHENDRFRTFFNATIGHGREALSLREVFLLNVPGVWGLICTSILLAYFSRPGLGLLATYLILINGVIHVGQAIRFKRSNPGLFTAVLIFLPLGITTLMSLMNTELVTGVDHVVGLSVAIGIHAMLLLKVRMNLKQIERNPG